MSTGSAVRKQIHQMTIAQFDAQFPNDAQQQRKLSARKLQYRVPLDVGYRHHRQAPLAQQHKIGEPRIGLDDGQRNRLRQGGDRAHCDRDKAPAVVSGIGELLTGHFGDADNAPFAAGVVDKGLISAAHLAQVTRCLMITDAVPDLATVTGRDSA